VSPARKARPASRARGAGARAKAKARKAAGRGGAARPASRRADLGAPVDGFFARQPPTLRPIAVELRRLVEEAAPDATASIKWGIPFFEIGGQMMCAIGAHRAHVNLVLPGAPGTYGDPAGRLAGEGKTGKHLTVRPGDDLPRDDVRRWLAVAAARARSGKGMR
jgi:hypothetical protein